MDLYLRGRGINHFGKDGVESFIINEYKLSPLADPEIKKLKICNDGKSFHNFIAYIYVRFAHNLLYFPFEGKRILNHESIKKAEKLNNKNFHFKIKSDYNKNFFIDNKRKSPVYQSKGIETPKPSAYLKELYSKNTFISRINKIYNNSVYDWAKNYSEKSNYNPLRHLNSLLSITKIFEDLAKKKKY